jgi:hypothetical protein
MRPTIGLGFRFTEHHLRSSVPLRTRKAQHAAVTAVLSVPQLTAEAMRYLPIAGIGGYVVAMPVA